MFRSRIIVSILVFSALTSFAFQVSLLGFSVLSNKNSFGMVYASSGGPLSGVIVYAHGDNGTGYAVTDNNGRFNITDGLQSGNYTVSTTYEQGYLNAEIDSVMVTAGSETSGLIFNLSLSGGIFGRVTDNVTGLGVPNTYVFATLSNGSGIYEGSGTTDTAGNYGIYTNLGSGTYNVSVFLPSGYIGKTTGPVSVTAGLSTTGITLSLQRSGIISGRITAPGGQGLANLTVSAYDQTFSTYGNAQTNATGYYRIASGLASSNYTVTVLSTSGGYASNMTYNVFVTAPNETPNVDMELTITPPPPSGIIMGTVMDTNNHPIPYASVAATGETSFDSGSAIADGNGNYTISEGLTDNDTYTVTASASGYLDQNFTGVQVFVSQITRQDFHLQAIPPAQSGRISGMVTGDANPITPEFQYPIAMMLVATLAAVAIARSASRKGKHPKSLQTAKVRRSESPSSTVFLI